VPCSWLDSDLETIPEMKVRIWNSFLNEVRLPGVHLVESTLEILELERIGDHSFRPNLAAVEILYGARETVYLRERSDDLPTVISH
jgi:hypothetical protein